MDLKIYLTILAALATAAALCLLTLLAAPVAEPLAWALIIGVATIPYRNSLLRRFPDRPSRAAGLMVLAVTVCFVVPVVALIVSAAQNAPDWFREAQHLVSTISQSGTDTLRRIPYVSRIIELADRAGVDLTAQAGKLAALASGFLVNAAGNAAKGLANLFFTLAVALFILFFIYRDGPRVVNLAIDRFADRGGRLKRILTEIQITITAVAIGTIFTCLAQGVTAGLGYWVAGVQAPVLWGGLTAVAALVPVVGTAVIWVPLVAYVALHGNYMAAGLLALWCLLFVGLADNLIRPLAVGAKSDISTLAIVLGAICGAATIGLLGLILGPVVMATIITVWHHLIGTDQPVEAPPEGPGHPESAGE